jgi:hypothetical protein
VCCVAAHRCVLSDLPVVKPLQRLLLQLSLGLCHANSMASTPAVFCVLLTESCVVMVQCLWVALVPCITHTGGDSNTAAHLVSGAAVSAQIYVEACVCVNVCMHVCASSRRSSGSSRGLCRCLRVALHGDVCIWRLSCAAAIITMLLGWKGQLRVQGSWPLLLPDPINTALLSQTTQPPS